MLGWLLSPQGISLSLHYNSSSIWATLPKWPVNLNLLIAVFFKQLPSVPRENNFVVQEEKKTKNNPQFVRSRNTAEGERLLINIFRTSYSLTCLLPSCKSTVSKRNSDSCWGWGWLLSTTWDVFKSNGWFEFCCAINAQFITLFLIFIFTW